jgi:Protein of unknown function (DUF3551)
MRGAMITAAAAVASIMTAAATSSAQSPYSYPWCHRTPKTDGDVTSCYFTSYRECMTTLSGIGGYCYYNHAYRGRGRLYR